MGTKKKLSKQASRTAEARGTTSVMAKILSMVSYVIYWSCFNAVSFVRFIVSWYSLGMAAVKSMLSQLVLHSQVKAPGDLCGYVQLKIKSYTNITYDGLPQHLAIILNQSDQQLVLERQREQQLHGVGDKLSDQARVFYEKLSDILVWSLVIGIPRITIFDSFGHLKSHDFPVLKAIFESKAENLQGNQKRYVTNWLNQQEQHKCSADKHQQQLDISIVSVSDGKQELIDITKRFIRENQNQYNESTFKPINETYINSKLPNHLGGLNFEPEVALDFSEKYIFSGFLPWHIKVTEFIKVDHFQHFYLEKFLEFLNDYQSIQKRFGK